jgi:hypothetical protein
VDVPIPHAQQREIELIGYSRQRTSRTHSLMVHIAYVLWTSNMQHGHIAMLISSNLQTNLKKAAADKTDFAARLKSIGKAINYPMLLAGNFIVIQRKSHVMMME